MLGQYFWSIQANQHPFVKTIVRFFHTLHEIYKTLKQIYEFRNIQKDYIKSKLKGGFIVT